MAEGPAESSANLRIHRALSRALRLEDSRAALQSIAEAVAEAAGFKIAAISHLREDGLLQYVAVSGDVDARATLLDQLYPRSEFDHELSQADEWGALRFVPQGRIPLEHQMTSWVPVLEEVSTPGSWLPEDLLLAPLYDEDESLVGALSVDLPIDGMRPDEATCALLEDYAAQAGRAVVETLARGELSEQVRLSAAVNAVIRAASIRQGVGRMLEDCKPALIEGFRAYALRLQTFDEDGYSSSVSYHSDGQELLTIDGLHALGGIAARETWREQRVGVVSRRYVPPGMDPEHEKQIQVYLERAGLASIMFVPVGAGSEVLGYLVISRQHEAGGWSRHEQTAALEIGHDLGRAILNSRLAEREQRLVRELTEIDTYKSQLIATISHELKNPLTAITGHAELLESAPELTHSSRASLDAVRRNAARLGRVAEDLLTFSRVGSAGATCEPVDLGEVVAGAMDVVGIQAGHKEITVEVETPAEPLLVHGERTNLERLATNLISNAVKYTPGGGNVSVRVEQHGDDVVLSIRDDGIGIAPGDLPSLFGEFYRSTNPEALATEGTGLGLAIARRIAERHGGRISVDSQPGLGSTFTVVLPVLERRV